MAWLRLFINFIKSLNSLLKLLSLLPHFVLVFLLLILTCYSRLGYHVPTQRTGSVQHFQLAIKCSKLAVETLEHGVKFVQS